ncbi:MAG: GntR family transcriptional regulator [Spirochaetaceae bacterium]|nr:GntR family transcriptional regulator [Spirochaetaceae bacterium]
MSGIIEYEDLAEKVYKSLKEMILDGQLSPGEKLRQEELSEKLGVSRTPLAAAFSKLEKEMLVELLPRRGARVRSLSYSELMDLFEVRSRIEPLGAWRAAQAVAEGAIDAGPIRIALAAYRAAIEDGSSPAIKRADYEFHLALMRLGGNEALYRIVSSFNIVFISNQRGLLKPALQSLAEHEELAAAVERGDAQAAEAIMVHHLDGARRALLARVEREERAEGEARA